MRNSNSNNQQPTASQSVVILLTLKVRYLNH